MSQIILSNQNISEWFRDLKDNVDVWITDPPYPFDNSNGANRFKFSYDKDDMYSRFDWNGMYDLFVAMHMASNDGARACIFCNRDGLTKTIELLEKAGWVFRNILIWNKQSMGMGYHFRNSAEYIVYATKKKPKVYATKIGNVFSYKPPSAKNAIPSIGYDPSGLSSKPLEIWRDIIQNIVLKDEIIADPFAGTNPMRAALLTNPALLNLISKAYTNSFDI